MKLYLVTVGLGRLCQFPKQIKVEAKDASDAASKARSQYRQLIDAELKDTEDSGMLNKIATVDNVEVCHA